QQRPDAFDESHALERGDFNQFQIESFARDDLRLKPPRSAHKENLRIRVTPPELLRDGDAGGDVPTRAAASDDDGEGKGSGGDGEGRVTRLGAVHFCLFQLTHL